MDPDNTILVSEELSPAMLGEVPAEKLVGLEVLHWVCNFSCSEFQLAPWYLTVVAAVDLPYTRLDGIELIIDGYHGDVLPIPALDSAPAIC